MEISFLLKKLRLRFKNLRVFSLEEMNMFICILFLGMFYCTFFKFLFRNEEILKYIGKKLIEDLINLNDRVKFII